MCGCWVRSKATESSSCRCLTNRGSLLSLPSHRRKRSVCWQKYKNMLDKQAISSTEEGPEDFYSQMFLVPKKYGRQRPVINLKRLNQSVKTEHFKMEGIHMLKDLLRAGDWMAKIDLKDAYFMIPIAQEDREFLKFQWKDRSYQFNCLPFGLFSAPWVFTKTTRPVVVALREVGVRLIIYIDDILVMAETVFITGPYLSSGVPAGEPGVCDQPPQVTTHPISRDRVPGVHSQLLPDGAETPRGEDQKDKGRGRQSPASSLSVSPCPVEKMNAATQAIQMALLYYRNLQSCLREALQEDQDYSSAVTLTQEAPEELEWWKVHFTQWNGRSLIAHNSSLTIETDASKKGWGAVCDGVRTGGPWSPKESRLHINCQELLAAFLAVKCFAKGKTHVTIHLKMDSMSALTYIANDESRVMKDRCDWKLCPRIFHLIDKRLGPLELDLFASRLTHQLPRYVSWRPDPAAIATDAFTLNWAELRTYADPPWNLIGRVLAQTRRQQAELVLVAPVWKAQGWYPELLEMLVRPPLLIPQRRDLVTATHPDSLPEVVPQLAVWAISGSATETARFRRELRSCSWRHGNRSHPGRMTHSLESGSAGVVNGTVIPFHAL